MGKRESKLNRKMVRYFTMTRTFDISKAKERLEAMNLMRKLGQCVHLLDKLQTLATVRFLLRNSLYTMLIRNIAISNHYLELSSRRQAIYSTLPTHSGRYSITTLFLSTHVCTTDEYNTTNFQEPSPSGYENVVKKGNRLGCMSQHARGPLFRGQCSSLLTRREAGRVRLFGFDSAALGCRDGGAPQHARGPLPVGQCSSLLTRRAIALLYSGCR